MAAALLAGIAAAPASSEPSAGLSAAASVTLPSHSVVVKATKLAADYYRPTYAHTTVTPGNGWSWATYAEGIQALYRQAGDARYLSDGLSWGRSSGWQPQTSGGTNPDTVKAGQTYYDLNAIDPTASLSAMDARMATDLTSLPVSQYDWVDALFMGLPDWARWAARTGNPAYLTKLDALYTWTRDQGATGARCAGTPMPQPGLYSATQGLWYRDCTYVAAKDANGQPIFWGRGNGWAAAAMADVVQSLSAGDPQSAKYADMLRTLAARLAQLQSSDGFWRSSLLDTALYPQPETSGTALITYALAAGIKAGVLDAATYLPVVARAWQGLSTLALQPSGFVTDCQGPGVAPAAPYTATAPRTAPTPTSAGTVNDDSPPYCVGAFLLAGSAVARLLPSAATGRPVAFTSQQVGNEASRVDDGDVTTRWSAQGFPQSVTVDLGATAPLSNAMVVPYVDRAYRYRIETSIDGTHWQLVVDRTANTSVGSALDDFTPGTVNARYARLTVTGIAGASTTWVAVQEFGVYPPAASPPAAYATDTFSRSASNGWGSADMGGAWTLGGAGSLFSVSGGTGKIRMAAAGSGPAALLNSVSAGNVDITVDASLDKVATGGGTYVMVAVRHIGTAEYWSKLKCAPTGAVTLSLSKVVGGVETTLRSQAIAGVLAAPGEQLRIRFQAVGSGSTALSAKVWKTTATEPAGWQLSTTDTTAQLQEPGGVGLWTYLSGSATNAPVTASFDNLVAVPLP
jgi:rhamnogalacturonyl hydrolase YesR